MSMRVALNILKVLGKTALNVSSGGLLGDVLTHAAPAVAQTAWETWRKEQSEQQQREEIQAIVRMAAAEIRDEVRKVIRELAADRPLEIQLELEQSMLQLTDVLREQPRFEDDSPVKQSSVRGFTNSVGMSFQLIPRGEFLMGSPVSELGRVDDELQHTVTIPRPFLLGVYPVTQAEFVRVMGFNPASFPERYGGGPRFPVETVSWNEAKTFCERLTEMNEEVIAGRIYRLPTEAEWEYACRAGTKSAYSTGERLSSSQAHFRGKQVFTGCRENIPADRTCRVGLFEPNEWGLHDMHGNVREWCEDWYSETYMIISGSQIVPTSGEQKVVRGGSWNNTSHSCRSAKRNRYHPTFQSETIGFRVVCEVQLKVAESSAG